MDELEEALSRHEILQRFKKLLGREMNPSLLNSPELRFVCEAVRSGVDERQNRPGHEVWKGQFDVAT
jgi:hypothetical protein